MNDQDRDVLRKAADALIRGNGLGKSETHRKLFQYLLDRALQGNPPREVEIAFDVFNKDASFTGSEDALVRVHVRALRTKLEEYYRGPGKDDPYRLGIPKGGYRLVATPADPAEKPSDTGTPSPPADRSRWRRPSLATTFLLVLLGISLAAHVASWNTRRTDDPELPAVDASAVWQTLLQSRRPITLVLGDFFLFSRTMDDGALVRVVDPRVRSAADLQRFLSAHAGQDPNLGRSQTTLLPKSVAVSLGSVLPIVERSGRPWSLRLGSELRYEDLRDTDVFYFGPLNRMGLIADFVTPAVTFRYRPDYILEDSTNGEIYASGGEDPGLLTDYALFATVPGPAGNRILVFGNAGRDIGLLRLIDQMTSTAGLGELLDELLPPGGQVPEYFEALLAVKGYDRTDLGADIIAARTIAAPQNKR